MSPEQISLLAALGDNAVKALAIREGSLVEIRADASAHEWAESMAMSVETAGGIPFLNVVSLEHFRERILTLPVERLRVPPPFLMEMAEKVDAMIVIQRDWSELVRTSPPEKLAAWNQGMGTLVRRLEERRVPDCQIAHPDTASGESLSVTREELHRILEMALTADLFEIQKSAESFAAKLSVQESLEIVSGSEHRLFIQYSGRPVWRGDAKLRESCVINFPAGSVYFPPLESSPEGSIYFEQWQDVKGLVLSFQNGRVLNVEADRNVESLKELLALHTGDKDRISHIGIGLNPCVSAYTGHTSLDECRAGAVFLALGENRYMGGENASTLNIDFVSQGCTVVVGEEVLVTNGKLAI